MTWRRAVLFLLLLLSGVRADTQEKAVSAMVGSDVKLSCVHDQEKSFDLIELFVYWQITIGGKPDSVIYYLAGNSSVGYGDNQYKDRAQMSLDSLKQGDFSLYLHNITPQDEQKFNCLVFRDLKKIVDISVTLHVAANYSMPVVRAPQNTPKDKNLTFTCTSTDGYPWPNVYWINKTDNSLLDRALQKNLVSVNARGLYDVVSTLNIPWSTNVNVGCCIENVLLHQNLTVSSQPELLNGTNASITGDPDDTRSNNQGNAPSEKPSTWLVVLIVVGVAAIVAAAWIYRSRCSCRNYAGAQSSKPELEFTDHV